MPPTKGKQATKGAKQIKEENQQTYNFYSYIIVAANIPVIIFHVLLKYQDLQWSEMIFLCLSTIIYALCMKTMSSMVNSGLDLNMSSGMAEHIKDILIITAVCQAGSCYSLYFWLLWLVVPAIALYKLWVNILAPWIFQQPEELTDKQKKKLEKRRRMQ